MFRLRRAPLNMTRTWVCEQTVRNLTRLRLRGNDNSTESNRRFDGVNDNCSWGGSCQRRRFDCAQRDAAPWGCWSSKRRFDCAQRDADPWDGDCGRDASTALSVTLLLGLVVRMTKTAPHDKTQPEWSCREDGIPCADWRHDGHAPALLRRSRLCVARGFNPGECM